jgi:cholesterol transport system auxiliary component
MKRFVSFNARLPGPLYAIAIGAVLLSACATPDKPVRSMQYDFGSVTADAAPARAGAMLPPIVLGDVAAAGSLEGSLMFYRLGYADGHQLRPYAQARWSAPPPQLIRQRLRQKIGEDRPVLDPSEGAALAREGGALPRALRLELEEFSHLFESPSRSWGVVRLRASLFESTPAGERLVGQRGIVSRQPAPTPDASGGVRGLAAATDAAADEIRQWLAQQR